jgi:hypothetical protein
MREDVDVNPKDGHGRTLLSLAARHGYEVIIMLVLIRKTIIVVRHHRWVLKMLKIRILKMGTRG